MQNSPPEQQPEQSSNRITGRSIALPTLLSFVFAAIFIVFLLTRFDISLSETWRDIKAANPWWYFAGFLLYYSTFILRGYRWRILLQNAKIYDKNTKKQPSIFELSLFVFISFFANSIAFLSLGDAFRGFLLSDKWKGSFSKIIGTILAERILDIAIIFVLILAASIGVLNAGASSTAKQVVAGSGAAALIVGLALITMRFYGERLSRRLPAKLHGPYDKFHAGTMGSFQNLSLLATLTVVIWLFEAGRLYLIIHALGFDIGIALILFAALANSLLTKVPVTPGGLGVVELGLAGLLALSVAKEDAATITLLDRSISYMSLVIFGGIAFAVRQLIVMRQNRKKAATRVN